MASKTFLGLFNLDVEERADLYYRRGNLAKAAELFTKAGRFGQAAALYAEDGAVDRAVEVLMQAQLPIQAAEMLEAHGRRREAVTLFEEGGAFRRAAEACSALQQHVRAGHLFERASLFHAAAESFVKAGELERALTSWKRESEQLKRQRDEHGDEVATARIRELDLHRADLLAQVGRHAEAAALLIGLDQQRRAAPLLERAGQAPAAARAYLEAGLFENALDLLERDHERDGAETIDANLRLEILLHNGRDAEAGVLLEAMGRYDEAAASFEDAMEWGKAARLWEKAEHASRAAELYFRVERYEEAGECYAKADDHEKAGKAFALAGNDRAAADAYLAADALLKAGEHYFKARDVDAAQDALQGIAADDPAFARASLLLVPLLLDRGLAEGARHRLELLEQSPHRDRISAPSRFYWQGRVVESLGDFAAAEVMYQKVLAERTGFRDTGRRLAQVRARSQALEAAAGPLATAPIPVAALDRTQLAPRISLDPPSAAASTSTAGPVVPELDADVAEALTGLPFEVDECLKPWWPATVLLAVRSFRSKKPGLLLIFPLDVLGPGAEAFRREAARIQALEQPAILELEEIILTDRHAVLHYGAFGDSAGCAPLARQLDGPWRPLPTSALNLLVQICDALAAAHQLGVAHQWLSPNTILIDDFEHVRLVGFGLESLVSRDDSTTAAYRAPELSRGLQAGPAADVYSFGLLGVELLGALLPAGWSQADAVDPAGVHWPETLDEIVPESIRGALLRCLARNPLERPSTEAMKSHLSVVGLVPGQILQARYEILGELGRGGMSRVYRAYDKMIDEQVAIKTLLSPMLRHSMEERRLMREVRICRKISHPNVVRVHDLGNFPGGIFITMELLDGEGLDAVIRRDAPLPLARVRVIVGQIAQALGEAHRLHVIHRDLKPGNVYVADDRVKVLDFGIARMGEAGAQASMTRTGEVIGSPLYMAPEQIQGKPLTGACDLYALGVMTYTLLTGREPFLGDSPTAVVYQHLRDAPPDPRDFRADLPAPWLAFLDRLLAKKPADRYADAGEVSAVLRELPVDA